MRFTFSILIVFFAAYAYSQTPAMLNYAELESRISAQHENEIVVYNFWATWCKPCVEEMPYFEQLHAEYAKHGVKVVFVSLDFSSKQQKVAEFVNAKKLQAEVIMLVDPDANTWIDKVSKSWSGAIPATLVVKGEQTLFHEGAFTYKELSSFIKPLL